MVLDTFLIVNTTLFSMMVAKKLIYTKITDKHAVFNTILNDGLYHITSKENADKILESGYIKPSNIISSYGTRKCFFHAGIPNFDVLCLNANKITPEMYAIKIKPTYEQLAQFRHREYSDNAITYEGRCNLEDKQVELVKLIVELENNKLVNKETDVNYEYYPTEEIINKINLNNRLIAKLNQIKEGLKFEFKMLYKQLTSLFENKRYKVYRTKHFLNKIDLIKYQKKKLQN